MSLRDDIDLLSQVSLFSGLDEEPLRLLAFGAEKRTVDKGETLLSAGSKPSAAFVVSGGAFALATPSRAGQAPISDALPGTLLCELALISDIDCRITAKAAEASEVIVITRSLFHRLMQEFPEIALRIEEQIRQNLEAMVREAARMQSRFS
jgi:CRP-like cAMP-binding protein